MSPASWFTSFFSSPVQKHGLTCIKPHSRDRWMNFKYKSPVFPTMLKSENECAHFTWVEKRSKRLRKFAQSDISRMAEPKLEPLAESTAWVLSQHPRFQLGVERPEGVHEGCFPGPGEAPRGLLSCGLGDDNTRTLSRLWPYAHGCLALHCKGSCHTRTRVLPELCAKRGSRPARTTCLLGQNLYHKPTDTSDMMLSTLSALMKLSS